MIRRPPRSTRTDTLFPYTTPSDLAGRIEHRQCTAVAAGLDGAGLFAAIRGDRPDADAAAHLRQPRGGAFAAAGRRGGVTRDGGEQLGRPMGVCTRGLQFEACRVREAFVTSCSYRVLPVHYIKTS